MLPASKLKAMPTPIHPARGSAWRNASINLSCLGLPRATRTMSDSPPRASRLFLAIRSRCCWLPADGWSRLRCRGRDGEPSELPRPFEPHRALRPGETWIVPRDRRGGEASNQTGTGDSLRQRRSPQIAGPDQRHSISGHEACLLVQGCKTLILYKPAQVVQIHRVHRSSPLCVERVENQFHALLFCNRVQPRTL